MAAPVRGRDSPRVETMWAIRKLRREPGLVLDRVPDSGARPARRARAGRGRERLRHRPPHLQVGRLGEGTDQAAADARSRVRRHRRRDGRGRAHRRSRRLRLGREPRHLRDVLPLPHRPRAHVRAHADPRRRPRRRVRRVRRRARVGDLAERPPEAAARDRDAAGAVRQRRVRDLDAGPARAHGRRARLRARSASSRSRSREPPAPAACWPRITCRSGSRSRRRSAPRSPTSNEVADVSGWFHDANEGAGLDVVFEMSGAAGAVRDAFRIVRNGGDVVLFGIPSSPVELDIAESLIFKNLHVTAVNGREVFATWYRTRWLLEHGVVDLQAARHAPLPDHRVRGRIRGARVGQRLQDRPPSGRRARDAARHATPALSAEPEPMLTGLGKWVHR